MNTRSFVVKRFLGLSSSTVMKFLVILRISLISILTYGESESISWDKLITSKSYENTRLVMETENLFHPLNISKENPIGTSRIHCSQFCVNNAKCLGFNFYVTSSQYVCEFLPENFCSNRQRIALQQWPGGTVWDKLSPGMTKACIDREFENKTSAALCETGRSGCRPGSTGSSQSWPNCNNCVRTCIDCYALYRNAESRYDCTLWPEGSLQAPIFGICYQKDTFLVRKSINPSTGYISPNYRMTFRDMNRLCQLNVYEKLGFFFITDYSADYQNFYIHENGTLTNMTLVPGQIDDGLNIGNKPLQPSPWIETDSDCGSFWLLNSSHSFSTLQCPGGGVSMFGKLNLQNSQTGIRWPKATTDKKILFYVSMRMAP